MDKKIRFTVRNRKDVTHETVQEALENFDDVGEIENQMCEETFGHYSEEITNHSFSSEVRNVAQSCEDLKHQLAYIEFLKGKSNLTLLKDRSKKAFIGLYSFAMLILFILNPLFWIDLIIEEYFYNKKRKEFLVNVRKTFSDINKLL